MLVVLHAEGSHAAAVTGGGGVSGGGGEEEGKGESGGVCGAVMDDRKGSSD